jgi:threonine/homoserine/homoserine lactone efflux protein
MLCNSDRLVMSVLDARFAAWIAVAIILIVTPGPDTALIIRQALRAGARAASLSAVGVSAGSLVWATASMLGVAVLLESSAAAFTLVKLAGAAYIFYLGIRSLVGSFGTAPNAASDTAPPKQRGSRAASAFAQGMLNNLLNPKAGAIFVTVMPQFIQHDDSLVRLFLMVACYEVIVVAWLSLYAYVVSRAGRSRIGAGMRRGLERLTGVVMVGLGVRLAFERP